MEALTMTLSLVILIPVAWSFIKPLDNRPRVFIIPMAAALVTLQLVQISTDGWFAILMAALWLLVFAGNIIVYRNIELDKQHEDVLR